MRGSGQLEKGDNVWHISQNAAAPMASAILTKTSRVKTATNGKVFPRKRRQQIEHELANGTFLIPSTITVKEFLMERLPKQCNKHKWAPCTYQSNLGTVQNLIIPYIGDMQMQKLKPYHLEDLYATLGKTPCGQYLEGKK